MKAPTSARLSARVPALPSVLLALLAALLLLTLLLPQINPARRFIAPRRIANASSLSRKLFHTPGEMPPGV